MKKLTIIGFFVVLLTLLFNMSLIKADQPGRLMCDEFPYCTIQTGGCPGLGGQYPGMLCTLWCVGYIEPGPYYCGIYNENWNP